MSILVAVLFACSKKTDVVTSPAGNADGKPIVNFGFSIDNSDPTIVHFTDSSKNIDGNATYIWDFGDGKSSTAKSPSHTYDSASVYTVKLKILNLGGGKDKDSLVNPNVNLPKTIPIPSFTITRNTAYPSSFVFKNTSTNAKYCLLDFNDKYSPWPTTIDLNGEIKHDYGQSGPIVITLTATSKSNNKRSISVPIILDTKEATVTGIEVERIPEIPYADDGYADLFFNVYSLDGTSIATTNNPVHNTILPYRWTVNNTDPNKKLIVYNIFDSFLGGNYSLELYDKNIPPTPDYLIDKFNFSILYAVKNSGSASPYPDNVYIKNILDPKDVTKNIQIKIFLTWSNIKT